VVSFTLWPIYSQGEFPVPIQCVPGGSQTSPHIWKTDLLLLPGTAAQLRSSAAALDTTMAQLFHNSNVTFHYVRI